MNSSTGERYFQKFPKNHETITLEFLENISDSCFSFDIDFNDQTKDYSSEFDILLNGVPPTSNSHQPIFIDLRRELNKLVIFNLDHISEQRYVSPRVM